MDQELLNLVYAAVGIAVALIGNFAWGKLKQRADYYEIEEMARRIVAAAQQQWGTDNEQKLAYAVHQLGEWVRSKGWNIGDDLIRMFVEQAVFYLKQYKK